jgi:hypothetical protein
VVGGLIRVLTVRDPSERHVLVALYCGMLGILVASYGNQVLGQMPTGMVIYFTLAFVFVPGDPGLDQKQRITLRPTSLSLHRSPSC